MNRVETHIGTIAYRRAGAGPPLLLLHGGLSDGRSWTPQLAELDRPPAEWVDSYLAGFFGHSVPQETVEAVRTMMLDVRPAGVLSMVTAFANADLRAVLPTIAVPTLLIYGAEDVRAPRGVAEALHAAIPGSRLILVPAAGHDVNLEAPREYDDAVRAFLQTVDEPANPQCQ